MFGFLFVALVFGLTGFVCGLWRADYLAGLCAANERRVRAEGDVIALPIARRLREELAAERERRRVAELRLDTVVVALGLYGAGRADGGRLAREALVK